MPYPHSSSVAETEPRCNGREGNHMKSNHYGQELAGWLVSGNCVYSAACALLYVSHTGGGWQSCQWGWQRVQMTGQVGPCLFPAEIIESAWTVGRRHLQQWEVQMPHSQKLQRFLTSGLRPFSFILFLFLCTCCFCFLNFLTTQAQIIVELPKYNFHRLTSFSISSGIAIILCYLSRVLQKKKGYVWFSPCCNI